MGAVSGPGCIEVQGQFQRDIFAVRVFTQPTPERTKHVKQQQELTELNKEVAKRETSK